MNESNKLAFAMFCLGEVAAYYQQLPQFEDEFWSINHHTISNANYSRKGFAVELLQQVFRSKFILSESDIEHILTMFDETIESMVHRSNMDLTHAYNDLVYSFPIAFTFRQLERCIEENHLLKSLKNKLSQSYLNKKVQIYNHNIKSIDIVNNVLHRLFASAIQIDQCPIVFVNEDDFFGQTLNQSTLQSLPSQRNILYGLLAHYKKVSGGKPSDKYIQEVRQLYRQLGPSEVYISYVKAWLKGFKQTEVQSQTHTTHYGYTYSTYTFLHEINALIAKGIIWSLVGLVEQDDELTKLLTGVAEKCYQKIPGQGPAAAGVGNACLYVLAQSGMIGVGQLSRLKLRIKQANTQAIIEKYIQEASARLGVSPQLIEDMAVVDYGLKDGTVTHSLGGYTAVITIVGIGKVELHWFKSDGIQLKAEPTSIKKEFATELKALKNTIRDIAQNTTAQRDRLDRSMILDRQWTWSNFRNYYAQHGLMSFLAKRLIWTVEKEGQTVDIFYQNNAWADLNGNPVNWLDADTIVRLWHPVGKRMDTVISWREFLEKHSIKQPFKQAFREIYLLTDAELTTRTYSNRMAAHILKQHQFNTLAKGRGWRYSLLGAYDKGYDSEKAQIELPTYNLKAEFWVSEVDADDAWNDTGIYLYISTDQVRFTRLNENDTLPLPEIPQLVFTEIMRDVDLFVGVASVGNDPNWRDGGLTQFRPYWESYSFGELGELAKSRKQAIERLVPRLKIAHVAQVRDKFLVVQGKLRTYKIHLGSGNILMEPNDQYLCIVPDRSVATIKNTVFLPFEGDSILSIILSKAFLLADDDKITDPTITRQIK